MSEGTYGGAQPYQGADGLWHAQGADGLLYTYTQDANGFWYTQDAGGNQLLWTGGGWADVNSGEAAQAMADHLSGLLQQYQPPPQLGTDPFDAAAQAMVASGDPLAIQTGFNMDGIRGGMAGTWLDDPPPDVGDGDGTPDAYDWDPTDADVQTPVDPDPVDITDHDSPSGF